MGKPVAVDDSSFDDMVLKADQPTVVDLWAPWCQPCRMVAPILDELAEEYDKKIRFVKLDIDENPKTAARYGIMSIPTLLIFKNGEPFSQLVGLRPKSELKQSLEAALK